jgi:hypothetical protein
LVLPLEIIIRSSLDSLADDILVELSDAGDVAGG